jgi:hypothetical protein
VEYSRLNRLSAFDAARAVCDGAISAERLVEARVT